MFSSFDDFDPFAVDEFFFPNNDPVLTTAAAVSPPAQQPSYGADNGPTQQSRPAATQQRRNSQQQRSSNSQQSSSNSQQQQQRKRPAPPSQEQIAESKRASQELSAILDIGQSLEDDPPSAADIVEHLFEPPSVPTAQSSGVQPSQTVGSSSFQTKQQAPMDESNQTATPVYDSKEVFGLGGYGAKLYCNPTTGAFSFLIFDQYKHRVNKRGDYFVNGEGKITLFKAGLGLKLERKDCLAIISLLQTALNFQGDAIQHGVEASKNRLQSRSNVLLEHAYEQDRQMLARIQAERTKKNAAPFC